MQNQTAFLTALIKAQSERAPKTEFLIDGFSVPMDAQRQIYAPLRSKFASRIAGAQRIVAALRANTPAAKITDMTGLPLRNALRELATCSFYISHAGTMQHKAAWLYPLPGIQHGNAASLTPAALRWSAHMMDGAIVPIGLPGQLIDDTEICDQPRSTARNLDYRVNDIPAAVQLVLDTLDATPATTGAG